MAQNGKAQDPFVKGSKPQNGAAVKAKEENRTYSYVYSVQYEIFSLPLNEAAQLLRSGKTDSLIYKHLLEKGEQEALVVVRKRSGEKATSESIQEYIYPTEYDSTKIPNSVEVQLGSKKDEESGNAKSDNHEVGKPESANAEKLSKKSDSGLLDAIVAPATPTAFQTRNTGRTLEVELTVGERRRIGDLRISQELVYFVGNVTAGQGASKTTMPLFETQRLQTAATVQIGVPYLIGTMNRYPLSKLKGAEKIWFAMVTVRSVKI